MDAIVFILCNPCIVQLEVREIGCGMASDTITDSIRWERGECWWFRKEYFQACQLIRSELEVLRGVELKLTIGSIWIGGNELRGREAVDKTSKPPAVVEVGFIIVWLLRESIDL